MTYSFREKLAGYKQAIDKDLDAYATAIRETAATQYGQYVLEAETEIFLDMLQRGGKRLRGALVMTGYEMCGGTDRQIILAAARAIEMLHAYILIIDDIQDRARLRRGKPSAHEMLADYHRQHGLKGDAAHAGVSLALMAALAGAHAAQIILANLPADAQRKLHVLSIVNRTMAITAHGQTLDIMNQLVATPALDDIERVLEWKSALYSVTNPLHVGMVLAGAGCEATDAITPYGLHAGKAFQITDDILGVFGDEESLGKVPGDDIREGKGTVLTAYALAHTSAEDRAFLLGCLGKQDLAHEEFMRARHILKASGALDHARATAAEHVDAALAALTAGKAYWHDDGTAFLGDLAHLLQDRAN